MSPFSKVFKYFFNKDFRFIINHYKLNLYRNKSDEWLVKHLYKATFGKPLDLDNPITFNEKIQYLKLFNHDPLYEKLVDKYAVRDYVKDVAPDLNIVPLLGTYEHANEIDFDKLPNQFVLKCNHNSGLGLFVCRDKSKLTEKQIKKVRKDLDKALKFNFYYMTRESAYKNVKPLIICEQYLRDNDNVETLTDYKFYCFKGYVDCVMLCVGRETGKPLFYFFDEKWNLKRLNLNGKRAPEGFTIPKPSRMDEMFKIVSRLSKDMPFVRLDLYQSNDKIYFGEFTFCPLGGLDKNYLPETEKYFGDLIDIKGIRKN